VYVYWKVDTVGPVATVVAPTSLTNPATVTFNENASGVTASSVKIRNVDGDAAPVTRSCVTNTLEATPCTSSTVRKVYLTPDTSWVLGQSYTVTVNDTGAATVTDNLGNVSATSTGGFTAMTQTEELGTTHAWRTVNNARARGGSFEVERRAGASASYRFSGSSVTWITVTGPTYGKATVYVDGSSYGTFNNYATKRHFGVQRVMSGLGSGQHSVEIRPLGKKGARAATDKLVAVDAFVVGNSADTSPALTERWQRTTNNDASNGYYSIADLAGETATIDFAGPTITLHTAVGPKFGDVALLVDGTLVKTDDLYASNLSFGHTVTASGLGTGQHTLVVKVLGSNNAASGGSGVVLDAVSTG
jgi:hypothetical protein